METLSYKLPKKAISIIEELAKNELYQVSFKMYLSMCCASRGYFNASDYFYRESRDEQSHFKRLVEFLQSRGEESDVPEIPEPKIDFTDLKSGIRTNYELEIETTQKYDEAIKSMQGIDTMAYLELCNFMTTQKYALEKCNKDWLVIGQLKDDEDMLEFDKSYFGASESIV